MITGFVLFIILIVAAVIAGRRGHLVVDRVLSVLAGLALTGTAIGPRLLDGTSTVVNGIADAVTNIVH